jgi:sigma-B regulation protein RsbU (phosphoserine phosphatase)
VAASGESSNLRAAAVTHEAHGAKANVNGGDRAVGARPRPAREDRRPLVLVADDDHVTSRIIQGALAQVGFRTSKAHDGQSTLREIRREQPDLILLDVALPDASGIEICRSLQTEPGLGQVPVIFISGHEEVSIKIAGFDAGGVDYITKPLTVREVIARVRTHIRLKRAYESLAELQAQRIQKLAAAQEAFMPRPEDIPEAHFCVSFTQVLKAGGDFYDVIPLSADVIDYVVADASGHDLGASFWTAALKTLLCEYANAINSPREIVHLLNNALSRILPNGVFFTMIYARLNRATGQLQLVNAAHPPAVVLGGDYPTPEILWCEGDVVGAFPDAVFDCRELSVSRGDRLFFYSDGLIEPSELREGGVSGLVDVLCYWRAAPLQEAVRSTVDDYRCSGRCADDVLLMGIDV